MLRCVFRDVNDREIIMPSPLIVRIDVDEDAPADSLYAVFAYAETDELKSVVVLNDDQTVFSGVVDEEEHMFRPSGKHLIISARSMAAYLLDNEAAPCSYNHPSADLIYEIYAGPFGIRSGDSDDSVYFGELNVLKGDSCWSAIKNFCTARYSSTPRIGSDGALYMKGMVRDESVRFGGTGGVRYSNLSEEIKRCSEISAVNVRTADIGGYNMPVVNSDAAERGITRERYLNAMLTGSPMRCADAMIRSGASKAYSVKLRCPGCLLGTEGSMASVFDIPEEKDLYISALRYRLSSGEEYTDAVLKRRIS